MPTIGSGDPLAQVRIDPASLRGRPGFYRVGRSTTGRWWLVDPAGRPLLYKGCNAVIRQEVGRAGVNRYFQKVEQVYGADHGRFVADALAILRDAGFNGLGGWSLLFTPEAGHRQSGWPFVEIIAAREIVGPEHMLLAPHRDRPGLHPACNLDVFDAVGWDLIDQHLARICPGLRDNPSLLGYYSDNECTWGQPRTDRAWTGRLNDLDGPPTAATLLQRCLVQPEGRPGLAASWRWLLGRHGSVAAVARAWGADFADAAGLRALTDGRGVVLHSDAYLADHADFTRLWVREYHRRMHATLRRHDPNHLLMTTRHPAPPGPLVLEATAACFAEGLVDVLAMNCYRDAFRERVETFHRPTGMPVLNGEFSWCSGHFLDWGRFLRQERFSEEEKAAVALRGRMALDEAFCHPALIGYTWFKWYAGREFTDDAYGLADDQPLGAVVGNDGRINRFNAPLFRLIHPRLEGIATGAIEPFHVAGLGPVPQTLDRTS